MSLLEETQAKATATLELRDDKAAANLDDASISGSFDHKVNETLMPSPINAAEAIENTEVSPCHQCYSGSSD